MGTINSSIKNVSACAFASAIVIGIGLGSRFAVGNATEVPSGFVLINVSVNCHNRVLLDIFNLDG